MKFLILFKYIYQRNQNHMGVIMYGKKGTFRCVHRTCLIVICECNIVENDFFHISSLTFVKLLREYIEKKCISMICRYGSEKGRGT
mgnify:CR=1 FL=1